MSLWIEVDAIIGDRVEETATDMQRLADRLGVGVKCSFNGVEMRMPVNGSAGQLLSEFRRALARDEGVKIAFGYKKIKA